MNKQDRIEAAITTAASLFANLSKAPMVGPEIAATLTKEFLTDAAEEIRKTDDGKP